MICRASLICCFLLVALFRLHAETPREIEQSFTLPAGFEIRLVAAEPDIANPMTMCVDEHGVIYVTEAHTYRYGAKGSPFNPPTNPIKRIELGADGRAAKTTVVADGFPEPVVGVHVREGKLYATCLNELFAMDIGPDGKGINRKLLVKDAAVEWNPFGMYRVQVGPDDKLWLAIADHPRGQSVELTGSDGRKIKFRQTTGGMVRCNRDGSGLELVVQGFRAPYVFDFDPWGHLWHISNGEGSPNIYVNVIPGADYGFHSRAVSYSWLAGKEPLSPPVREMGAGANTGAIHYYSSNFPRDYWGNILVANWGSHGENPNNRMIYRFRREKNGRSRIGTADTELVEAAPFLTTTDPMFRPTQLVMAPDGGLYLCDWHGRDDESDKTGRIFKISYTGKKKNDGQVENLSRIALLGHLSHTVREQAERELVQAGESSLEPLGRVAATGDAFAAANAVWTLSRMNSAAATQTMTRGLKHRDARVRAHTLRQLRQAAAPALAELAAPLLRDADSEVRVEAALSLDSPAAIVQGLVAALKNNSIQRLRYQIGVELARRADEATIQQLWRRENLEDKRVALIAMDIARAENTALAGMAKEFAARDYIERQNVLRQLGGTLQIDAADAPMFLDRLEKGELQLTSAREKLQVLDLVESLAPKKLPAKFVLTSLQDRDAEVQRGAFRLVWQRVPKEPEFRTMALAIAKQPPSPEQQLEAIFALGALPAPTAAADWTAWLRHPSKAVVTVALRALRQAERPSELVKAVAALAPEIAARDADLGEEARLTLRMINVGNTQPPAPKPRDALAAAVLARLPKASATLGRFSFNSHKLGCFKCHSVRPDVSKLAPLLSDVGAASQPQYLVESILEPSKVLKTGFQNERIELKDGREFTGLVQATPSQLTVIVSADERVTVPVRNVVRRTQSQLSLMPEGLEVAVTEAELADMVAYLTSLKLKK